jgi:hypothetical protein
VIFSWNRQISVKNDGNVNGTVPGFSLDAVSYVFLRFAWEELHERLPLQTANPSIDFTMRDRVSTMREMAKSIVLVYKFPK